MSCSTQFQSEKQDCVLCCRFSLLKTELNKGDTFILQLVTKRIMRGTLLLTLFIGNRVSILFTVNSDRSSAA